MPVIPVLKRLRQEDGELENQPGPAKEFKANLGYIARPCLHFPPPPQNRALSSAHKVLLLGRFLCLDLCCLVLVLLLYFFCGH